MYEYELAQLKSAELRRQAQQWRRANAATDAARLVSETEGRVVGRGRGGLRHALRALRPHSAS